MKMASQLFKAGAPKSAETKTDSHGTILPMKMEGPVVQLDELTPVHCPCGQARRAFAGRPDAVASVHLVDIAATAVVHHHERTTEIYVVLEGEGWIELDGVRHRVRPMSAVYIRPGVRHRAIGHLRVLNIPVPAFDPSDEFVDSETAPGASTGTGVVVPG